MLASLMNTIRPVRSIRPDRYGPRHASGLSVVAAVMVLGTSPLLAQDQPVRLNFGVYSSNKPSAMVKVFKPALQELEERMTTRLGRDVDIRMQIARDYDQGIAHLTDGIVDFSRFGPASYLEAKRTNEGIRILAMENENDSKVFYGIIAVHADSDITDVKQLEGRSFAFGDEGSTIGRFLSQLYLEKNGIRAGDLSKYEYLGRHDKVGTAVAAGDFDAGALNEKTFKKLVEAGKPIRELVRFPNVTKPWIARADLDPAIFDALRESLLDITNRDALKGLKVDGFLAGSDDDYEEIRTAIANNYVFFTDPAEGPNELPVTQPVSTATPRIPSFEPALSAATATSVTRSEITHQGHQLTVNVVLPPSLFRQGEGQAGTHLTVNVHIPDTSTSTTSAGR